MVDVQMMSVPLKQSKNQRLRSSLIYIPIAQSSHYPIISLQSLSNQTKTPSPLEIDRLGTYTYLRYPHLRPKTLCRLSNAHHARRMVMQWNLRNRRVVRRANACQEGERLNRDSSDYAIANVGPILTSVLKQPQTSTLKERQEIGHLYLHAIHSE